MKIYPACLPIKERSSVDGYHSGWSRPIPYHILRKYAPGYTEIYDEFFKQVHYKMEIFDKCKDSNLLEDASRTAIYKTNTYYPPGQLQDMIHINYLLMLKGLGVMCARIVHSRSCFYSGGSGSPLMTR